MASCSEAELCCPACQDVFRDPVLLSCSHSFCRACLLSWWKQRRSQECPVCRAVCPWSDPPRNLALKNLCEAFLQEAGRTAPSESAPWCRLHFERLKLFCEDDRQPVCVVCRDAKIHADHRFRPVDEAARDRREELQEVLKPLQDRLKVLKDVKRNFTRTAEHIKCQCQMMERRMKEEFKKLHRFLEEEEEARMAALREEEEQRSRGMEEKLEALSMEILALSHTVRTTEEELRAEDAAFLMTCGAAQERVLSCPLPDEPRLGSGALMDRAKHLGNLSFHIWNNMKDLVSYSPVVLDPNSANPELLVSEDLTAVRHGKRRRLPENPERFEYWDSVLGSGLNSGTHSWDVEVGDNKDWELGVLAESVCRQGFVGSTAWSVELSDTGYRAFCPTQKYTELTVSETLRKIRIHLDWDRGQLTFSEPDTDTHIHTCTHTFTETLRPFLSTRSSLPLRILPVKISVLLQSPS